MSTTNEFKLAPPGTGLPKHELYIARIMSALRRWTGSRDSFNTLFQAERAAIERLVGSCMGDSGSRRVLIRRLPGMEDSSRYWSVWMTLDHLRIVHGGMDRIIGDLTNGRMPEGIASTATVKPSPEATRGVIAAFRKSCDALLETVAAAGNLKTRLRYSHPWFGPLDAYGWHALAAGHMGIHRAQIERIIREGPASAGRIVTEG